MVVYGPASQVAILGFWEARAVAIRCAVSKWQNYVFV
jgi:hypothetical protein